MRTFVDWEYSGVLERLLSSRAEVIETRNSRVRRLTNVMITFGSTPLVSSRKTSWKNALREWEWFMSGSNRIEDLHESVRHWWRPWADDHGEVGNNYSVQFRDSCGQWARRVDQVRLLLDGVRDHPYSRRNVITTWNTADMTSPFTKITNCHGTVIQAFVDMNNGLSLTTYQRSADVVCGLPHNLIQYWAFLLWLAKHAGKSVGSLTWIGGDVHLYDCHKELADRILDATPKCVVTPEMEYVPPSAWREVFEADDFRLIGSYSPVLTDRAEMVV